MEFITFNYFNTTTALSVTSGSLTAENLLLRDPSLQYVSDLFNNDLTICTLHFAFDQTQSVSRIGIDNMNWKDFTAFYNGVTANTFALTSTGSTNASDFSSNSESSMYMQATAVNCTSVTFDILSTQVANAEKAVGFIYLADTHVVFDRIPSAKNYKPKIVPQQVQHNLSDGGLRINNIANKYGVSLKFKHLTESFRDSLKSVYDLKVGFGFVAFPTMASWDKIMFESEWPGAFNGFEYSDDAVAAGFDMTINLREIS